MYIIMYVCSLYIGLCNLSLSFGIVVQSPEITFGKQSGSTLKEAQNSKHIQWGTKPFKWFLKLNYFLNNSRMTEPNKFKFGTVVKYYVPNKLQSYFMT